MASPAPGMPVRKPSSSEGDVFLPGIPSSGLGPPPAASSNGEVFLPRAPGQPVGPTADSPAKSPQRTIVSQNAAQPHLPPHASPGKPAKSDSGASILRLLGGELLPEDSLSGDYWHGLDPKSKTVFLTGYRHGQGPSEDDAAKPEFRFLGTDHFATLIAKLDKFYEIPENRRVFLSAAIQICFMEMAGKPQANIEQAIEQARKAFMRL